MRAATAAQHPLLSAALIARAANHPGHGTAFSATGLSSPIFHVLRVSRPFGDLFDWER